MGDKKVKKDKISEKCLSLRDMMKGNGYEDAHIDFCEFVLELCETTGTILGHMQVADLLNVIHYAHLVRLHDEGIIPFESDCLGHPSVMGLSATFAENIMGLKNSVDKDE
jgi:hypothetical protein